MCRSGAANVAVLQPVPFLKCIQATIQRHEPPIYIHTPIKKTAFIIPGHNKIEYPRFLKVSVCFLQLEVLYPGNS